MSVADVVTLVHASFSERFQFGSPYPSGLALGWSQLTGDATGGIVQVQFEAPSGFLYRLEFISGLVSGGVLDENWTVELVHGWAAQKTGFPLTAQAFNIIHALPAELNVGGTTHVPAGGDLEQMRRFPIGRSDTNIFGPQVIAEMKAPTNTNLLGYVFSIVLTYWPLEATYKAGFLSSFYEAPVAPPAT